ncbi:MAG: PKD repeat protein [Candidatus Azotimanducaceae bacterium]|jgi:PKD repeat protein
MIVLAERRKQLSLIFLCSLFCLSLGAQAAKPPMPDISLPSAVQGERAIAALGDRLPAVAASYGMGVSEFARDMRNDRTLWLDTRGRLFYVEVPEQASPANVDVYTQANYPLGQTFLLQSRPGASKTLYLDFNGHIITATGWNASSGVDPMYAAPWSADADINNFSDSELRNIQAMWRQVAEDFAPFDINVTTADPGFDALARSDAADKEYGSRALITPNTAYLDASYATSSGQIYSCGCGGVAYVGVFGRTSQDGQPALVFNNSVNGAGEAITHEVGHNLGLNHDGTSTVGYYQGHGTGETGWAPIMGVGYYQALVQWSKGEYLDASQSQDDYGMMGSYGLYPSVDDHGDNPASATTPVYALSDGGATSTATGTVETPADADVFVIAAGAGPVSITATTVAVDPNLDIQITLTDESGALLASANPADLLAASIDVIVGGGNYYITIDGVGKGDPLGTGYTDYGSLGGYKIVATYADGAGLVPPVAVFSSDYVTGTAPLTINVDGVGSIDASRWSWDFGDGNTAIGVTAGHTYTQSGVFDARLTVTSPDGLTDTAALSIDVINQPPVALGNSNAVSGEAPLSVDFSDGGSTDADGFIVAYRWDFGDGSSAFTADATHIYTSSGTFGATLTVTDNLGGDATLAVSTIDVTQSSIIDSVTSADVFIAGTILRSHTATHALDGTSQEITERESGGRKNSRYSYAQHSWLVSVPAGNSTVSVNGYAGPSGDDETFRLAYSFGAQSGLVGTLSSASSTRSSAPFDHGPGTLTITLDDTDQTGGNRSLDTAYIDQIFVRTRSDGGGVTTVPSAPTSLQVSVVGSSEVSLSWTDTANDEFGFRLERRAGGASWLSAADLGADSIGFNDSGLAASTNYDYRIFALNGAGDSAASNMASVTTEPVSNLTLSSSTFKVKGSNHVALQWSDASSTYSVFRSLSSQSMSTIGSSSNGQYLDDGLGKGGMTLYYQVCSGATCSNMITVIF